MNLTDRFFSGKKRIWGRNGTVGTAWESLYEYSQDIDFRAIMSTGAAVDISSASANDTSAGTGARKVTVYGLGTDWKETSEELTMNGQTKVTGTTTFLRVFGAAVTSHGSGNINAGNIHIIKTGTGGTYSGGVPGTLTSALCQILAGEGSGSSGMYTVPLGKRLRLDAISYGNYTQACQLGIFAQDNAGTDLSRAIEFILNMGNQASGHEDLRILELEWPEKTDILMRVKGASASAVTTAMMLLQEV